jgi:3-methyl-2-oxobutanoate hydroxymethyltransferase
MKPVTLTRLREMKRAGEKIACLTCYDASFAAVLREAGVEVLLVGDSLGMVIQGHDSTLPVTVSDMIYHTRCVRCGSGHTLLIADMPFMSYASPAQTLGNAARLMREGGAHMVKLEGAQVQVVRELGHHSIPVCAHLGLLPQSVHKLGGYRVQGRNAGAAEAMVAHAHELAAAGADLLVLESVPTALATRITEELEIPTIGIGAGPACDGQVLVLYDMLGITPGKRPRFSKNFLEGRSDVGEAVREYVRAVKAGSFPGPEHSFA